MKYLIMMCLFFQVISLTAFGQAYKYHTVAPEENVYRIAQKYNISAEAIYKLNPDARNGVNVGSKLVIPLQEEKVVNTSEPVSFKYHKVEKKETLFGLSQRYNVDIDEIKKYNKHLYSKELQQGEEVSIPVYAKTETPLPKAVAQGPPPVQITKTREHIILPKETKFGIARKYGMTVEELEKLNPKVDVLQPGMMIKVATNVIDEPVIITDDAFQFYEVQPQETIFGLTQRFQVDRDSLMALNPGLRDGLKSGMVLKVPTRDARGRELEDIEVEVTETAAGEARATRLEDNIKDRSTKNLVLMLPFNLNKINNDTISNSKNVIENDRVMRVSLDFYSGVMMALERAKELGISTNLQVFDTQRQAGKVTSIIQSNNFSNVDAVIGPLYQATSEEAASRLSATGIPVISPLTNRELRWMPNLYQARPSDDMLRDAMIDYIRNNSQGKNVIIIADGKNAALRNRLNNAIPGSRIVNPSDNNISEGSIATSILKDRENWVILESESVGLLSSATSALNRLARNNKITLFTTNKNSSFDSNVLANDHLGRLNFHFPSEYKEFDETVSDMFIDKYKSKYGYVPNNYTVRGYDLTLDILLRLAAMSSLEESVRANILTEYVENKFSYRPKANGGFYNDAIYIMHYNDDLTLSVAR
ncbi:LysM peptidoglycan-binding domain-containing protein [Antarcticibacterium flavum]|uniref:LysM peptidoglycan-binding domain-containing protein n=1 Tax=Antarcticibacterium flavum TaxID=2058175 RepID=A0A5B7X804_9FLAO|nr:MULTISPECIES: LysM peptidoglycan-binding domain-containing protein [Antarcticibacterium]MCM4159632.1 peptidoglycan-binding protein LysM [Antarcticibacterium sp. W02-3]QCY70878.1 LysM peptidoglycan-binding domain-containing protein [Antarcticibacterium flavum]